MRRVGIVVLALVWPLAAHAGRQPFNEILDVEVLPARGAELQARITDRIGTPGGEEDETATWWAGCFGLSHQVELVLPVEIAFAHADGATHFTWYAAEVRWRLARPGPLPGPRHIVPLVRLSVERGNEGQALEGAADLALGSDVTTGLHAVLNLGAVAVSTGEEVAARGGLGLTGQVTPSLRLGGELFVEHPILPSGDGTALSIGPDLSYTLGQFWITAGGLLGLGAPRPYATSLRLAWGVEF